MMSDHCWGLGEWGRGRGRDRGGEREGVGRKRREREWEREKRKGREREWGGGGRGEREGGEGNVVADHTPSIKTHFLSLLSRKVHLFHGNHFITATVSCLTYTREREREREIHVRG